MENVPSSPIFSALTDGKHIEPFAVTKKEAMRLVAMPKLVQRWMFYDWVTVVTREPSEQLKDEV